MPTRVTVFREGHTSGGKAVILHDKDTYEVLLEKSAKKLGLEPSKAVTASGDVVDVQKLNMDDIVYIIPNNAKSSGSGSGVDLFETLVPSCIGDMLVAESQPVGPGPDSGNGDTHGDGDVGAAGASAEGAPVALDESKDDSRGNEEAARNAAAPLDKGKGAANEGAVEEEFPTMNAFVLAEYVRDVYEDYGEAVISDSELREAVFNSLMVPGAIRETGTQLLVEEARRVAAELASEFEVSPGALEMEKASEAFARQLMEAEEAEDRRTEEDQHFARKLLEAEEEEQKKNDEAAAAFARKLAEEELQAEKNDEMLARKLAYEAPPREDTRGDRDAALALTLEEEERERLRAEERDRSYAEQLRREAEEEEKRKSEQRRRMEEDARMAALLQAEMEAETEGDALEGVMGPGYDRRLDRAVKDVLSVLPYIDHYKCKRVVTAAGLDVALATQILTANPSVSTTHRFRQAWDTDGTGAGTRHGSYYMVTLPLNTREAREVLSYMNPANRPQVVRIERIENTACWNRYERLLNGPHRRSGQPKINSRKSRRAPRAGGPFSQQDYSRFSPAEHVAFHGCRQGEDAHFNILRGGLDLKYARIGNCIWLAADSAYSMSGYQHTDPNTGLAAVFVCFVVSNHTQVSTIRGSQRAAIYNVYDNDAVYCGYVVTFNTNR